VKLIYSGNDDRFRITIKVHNSEQFYQAIKMLGFPCGGKRAVAKGYDQLLCKERKTAYGWKLVQ